MKRAVAGDTALDGSASRALKRLFPLCVAKERFVSLQLNSLENVSGGVELRIESALCAMKLGIPVVLFDHEDRENEADLILAAEAVTTATMAMMIRDCSGIVCLCLQADHADRLELPPMVQHNESQHGTAFTLSIDARNGITTGVSAADRVATIQAAIGKNACPNDLVRPGHIFPLRAREGGVLTRPGHTEGSVDLALLAGMKPAAVLCELMNPDGTMARGSQVLAYAKRQGLPTLTIDDIAAYRLAHEGRPEYRATLAAN